MSDFYDEISVLDMLVERGAVSAPATATALGGGVSNIVLAIDSPGRRAVFKQSLPTLRVSEVWNASQERTLAEAAGLQVAERILPDCVPGLFDVDASEYWLLMDRAPSSWGDWKQLLLCGTIDSSIGGQLGELLGRLQAGTAGGHGLPERLIGFEGFEELRLDPYYRTIAYRHPDLSPVILGAVEHLSNDPCVLVHGDFSPKNILVGPQGVPWIIDFEVAHFGASSFDVAFMLSHLALKSIHRPIDRAELHTTAVEFWSAYVHAATPDVRAMWHDVATDLGCLLLARVDGKSPAEYLNSTSQGQARSIAIGGLESPYRSIADLWLRIEQASDR